VVSEVFLASGARQSPDYASTVGQITDHLSPDSGVMTLNVGGVPYSLRSDNGPWNLKRFSKRGALSIEDYTSMTLSQLGG